MPAQQPKLSTPETPETSTPATPAATTPGRKARAKRDGPNASHLLVAAIRDAWAAGVPFTKAEPLFDMALSGTGVTGWQMLTDTFTGYAKAVKTKPDES